MCTKYVSSHIINFRYVLIAYVIIIRVEYFMHVHLLVLLHKYKYSFNACIWNILNSLVPDRQNQFIITRKPRRNCYPADDRKSNQNMLVTNM
jgi:hypothetical protein